MVGVSGMPDGPVQSTIDRLRFTLDITTSMPVKRNPASRCLNRFEHEDAVVVDVTAQLADWLDTDGGEDEDEDEEVFSAKLEMLKKLPAFVRSQLVLQSITSDEFDAYFGMEAKLIEMTSGFRHTAYRDHSETGVPDPDMVYTKSFTSEKGFFTAEELVDCIVEWEKIHRNVKTWFGAIDAHHVFFEGLSQCCDGQRVPIPGRYCPFYGS